MYEPVLAQAVRINGKCRLGPIEELSYCPLVTFLCLVVTRYIGYHLLGIDLRNSEAAIVQRHTVPYGQTEHSRFIFKRRLKRETLAAMARIRPWFSEEKLIISFHMNYLRNR